MDYYYGLPHCHDCDMEMLVKAGGVWVCPSCEEETTRDQFENDEDNRAENAWLRSCEYRGFPTRQDVEEAQIIWQAFKRDGL